MSASKKGEGEQKPGFHPRRPTGVCDERAKALRVLTRYSAGIDDACVHATRIAREDAAEVDKAYAINLALRRAARLAQDLLAAIDRVPR